MYATGDGVPEDDREAARLWILAAEQGFASAQYTLGVMYGNGTGVVQDFMYAHMWFNIAASNGDENSKEHIEEIEGLMTSSQIEEAQRLAKECVKKDYKGC